MTSVAQLSNKVQEYITKIISVSSSITDSYNSLSKSDNGQAQQGQATIDALNEQASTYDRKFEEEQYKFQLNGGKSRKQTLQEFVILFFFVAYAVFTVSLMLYAKTINASVGKVFGYMTFALFIITGIIVRYA
jgi:ABC-type multidrug transport system fused ATPase/permease subunit